jgi:hypothetical protein
MEVAWCCSCYHKAIRSNEAREHGARPSAFRQTCNDRRWFCLAIAQRCGYARNISQDSSERLGFIRTTGWATIACVHKLAGAVRIFDFQAVSFTEPALKEAIIERRTGRGAPGTVRPILIRFLNVLSAISNAKTPSSQRDATAGGSPAELPGPHRGGLGQSLVNQYE